MKKAILFQAMLVIGYLLFGQNQNALHFDGANDYINLPSSSAFQLTGDVTVEAWINRSSLGNGSKMIFINTIDPDKWGIFIATNNNKAQASVVINNTQLYCLGTTNISSGQWFHIAGVRDGGTLKIYVNGILENTTSISTNHLRTGNGLSRIGMSQLYQNHYFHGSIDELRVWNVARSTAEIQGVMNTELNGDESGLVAYYTFNQGVAGGDNTGMANLTDASSNVNNGTLKNFTLNGAASNWVDGAPIILLPVDFTSFVAKEIDGNILLEWKTASELNNYGFYIEHSTNGREWVEMGFEEGNGTTSNENIYSYVTIIRTSLLSTQASGF